MGGTALVFISGATFPLSKTVKTSSWCLRKGGHVETPFSSSAHQMGGLFEGREALFR